MPDYPVPFHGEPDGRWTSDMAEDYRNARSDDERRQILLAFGYDKDHEYEVLRLFGPPSNDPERSCNKPEEAHPAQREKSVEEKSLRWTMIGAIVSIVGILVSVLLALAIR